MPELTPNTRRTIYLSVIIIGIIWVVTYLVLAVVLPEHAARLLAAPSALIPVIVMIFTSAFAHANVPASNTPTGPDRGSDASGR